jgi:hypothetical protein
MADQNQQGVTELITAIDARVKNVHTQTLDLSFNELVDMYEAKELNISPEFQRLFQWSEGARSRFIESLLLEMPVPPIYVIEEEDGKYVLIDGLQRISSYLHLRGMLEAKHLDPPVEKGQKLKLSDCDIVAELNGKSFDDLGTALQIKLKRAFVNVKVVRKGSDVRFQYYMFKRLNTGGQVLSEQQIRNCTIRLLNKKFNDFIIELSKFPPFQTCIDAVSTERILAAFDQELVLRFFAFKNDQASFSHDVSDFMTEYMEKVSDSEKAKVVNFEYEDEDAIFKKTFSVLAATLGASSFSFANKAGNALTNGFSVYHFEALTIGIQPLLDKLNAGDAAQMGRLKDKLHALKIDPGFIKITTGGGRNSPGPLKARIGFVSEQLKEFQ